jgi:hypothetical protein
MCKPPETKPCTRCKITKPITEFHKQRQPYGIGFRPRCKPCVRTENNAYKKHRRLHKIEPRWEDVEDGREWI